MIDTLQWFFYFQFQFFSTILTLTHTQRLWSITILYLQLSNVRVIYCVLRRPSLIISSDSCHTVKLLVLYETIIHDFYYNQFTRKHILILFSPRVAWSRVDIFFGLFFLFFYEQCEVSLNFFQNSPRIFNAAVLLHYVVLHVLIVFLVNFVVSILLVFIQHVKRRD